MADIYWSGYEAGLHWGCPYYPKGFVHSLPHDEFMVWMRGFYDGKRDEDNNMPKIP
jgi:hypothetical protein